MQLVLASTSPQRQRLLADAGYEFVVAAPSPTAEDGLRPGEAPRRLVARLARQKAFDVSGRIRSGIIVACDTVVECGGNILGKPRDERRARQMLEMLSGKAHHVYSGLCVWQRPGGEPRVEVAVTKLRMDQLSEPQLAEYLESRDWRGKAGAFGYQDRMGWLHLVEGSESNVIGLPMELLAKMLDEL